MTPHERKLAPRDCYWMSPELLSPFGTEVFDALSQDQRHTLSPAELWNHVKALHGSLIDKYPARRLRELHDYIESYLWWVGESLFSPDAYNQVALKGYATRQRLPPESEPA
jgi:hypothetical protein